jgi:AmiR/NasT family two-component response regulator
VCPVTDGAPSENTTPTRVVVAEDEVLIRLDLVEMLTEEGYQVVGEAGDGEAAVAGSAQPSRSPVSGSRR